MGHVFLAIFLNFDFENLYLPIVSSVGHKAGPNSSQTSNWATYIWESHYKYLHPSYAHIKITFFWSFFLNLTLNHYACSSWTVEGIKHSITKVPWIIRHIVYIIVSFKVSADTAQTYVLTAEISTKNFFNFLRKFCTHKKLFWCNLFGNKMYKNIYKLFRNHAVSI